MATFLEIQTRVNRRVIDLPAAVTAEVPTLVNEASKRLQRRHNFKCMEAATAVLTTTVNTRTLSTVAVPADFKEFRGSPYLTDNSGRFIEVLTAANKNAVQREFSVDDPFDVGEPRVLLDGLPSDELNTRNWAIYPFADGLSDWSDGEYRITIPYWQYFAVLVNDADTNWFTIEAEEYLVNQAASIAFGLDWDEQRMAIYAQLAATEERDVKSTDKKFRLAGVDTFVPRQDVHGSRLRS